MKKLLIASTALVATAGVAAAEVTLSGSGRFGLVYSENNGVNDDTRLENRFRLDIRGTTVSDGGVTFTARVRIESNDQTDGQVGASGLETPEFGVTAGGFSLFLGETSDLIDSGDVLDFYGAGAGLTFFGEISSGFQLPNSGFGSVGPAQPTVKASYTAGPIAVGASYTTDATPNAAEEWQVGAGYRVNDNLRIGAVVGNEDDGLGTDNDFWTIAVDGSVGAIGYNLVVADTDAADSTAYGAGINYSLSAATSIRFVVSDNGMDTSDTAYAIGFRHGLGGGVTLAGGIGSNASDNTVADLGVSFSF